MRSASPTRCARSRRRAGAPPPAIEVAASRIVVEAVTNAIRHADARHCRVSLVRSRETLAIRIVDDGRGIGPGPVGVGTRAMYERAAEVGGELLVAASPDGGTVVSASLPVGAAGAAGPIGAADRTDPAALAAGPPPPA